MISVDPNNTSVVITGGQTSSAPQDSMLRRALAGRKPRIGVIGAGVAGLRCADVLLRHGMDVTVLEARNRVGGRLCQSKVAGHTVDLGPNWIHGTANNPILEMIKRANVPTHSIDEVQLLIDSNGNALDPAKAGKCVEVMWETLGEAFQHSNDITKDIPPQESLLEFATQASKKFLASEDAETEKNFLQLFETFGGFVGGSVDTQSLKYMWLEECLEGENLFCAGTYEKILEEIAAPAMNAAVIRFGEAVTEITSTDANADNKEINVSTRSGKSFTFDEVVITTPLGWLKRNEHAFSPALPTRFSEAIRAVGYGNLDKVYITFPRPWWHNDLSPLPAATHTIDQEAQSGVPNITATSMPLHQPQREEPVQPGIGDPLNPLQCQFPSFINWLSPSYTNSTNPSCETQSCLNMATLPEGTAHPTLLFYTSAQTSTHLATVLKDQPDEASREKAIWSFFQPYIARLQGYDSASPACQPSGLLATTWQNDEFAGFGSYTNFTVGVEGADEHIRILRHGMPERGVRFAGEHTAPFVGLGTVTGAWWSGGRVAREVLTGWGVEVAVGEGELEPEDSIRGG